MLSLLKHVTGLGNNAFADGGGGDLPAIALEQADFQFVFQLFNGHAERGLADMALLGGFAKMPGFLQGDDVA